MTVPRFVRVFGERRTWGDTLYSLLGLPLGIAGFVFTAVTLSVSGGLLVTFVGLPLLAVTGLVSRWLGFSYRAIANSLTTASIPAPSGFRSRPGLLGWIGSCLTDGTAWRARLYLVLKLPLGIASFVTATAFWSYGLGGLTYAVWRPFLPCNSGSSVCHRGTQFGSHYTMDTAPRILMVFGAGLLVTLAAPWVVRLPVLIDNAIAGPLLGPSSRDQRVAELEQSRAVAVDDAAATLRRIERDLHDGTQARLVALAMNVGLAKEKLAEGGSADDARGLLDAAHVSAKQAISEVRDLARGIHPPVLDAGLDAALATLAAHSVVPVQVRTELPRRPAQVIETIAYFCVAELLTNTAKHSGARAATVDVSEQHGMLVAVVGDDGHGGAAIGRGTGLRGLIERVSTVDGTLAVDSPPGGPTRVTVRLPMGLPR